MNREKLTEHQKENKRKDIAGLLLASVLLPLLLPFLLIIFVYDILSKFTLTFLAWSVWCTRGKYVLFVWSDSPIWKEYIEQELLPEIEHRAVKLNLSQRNQWSRWSLAVRVFNFFGGTREFNPMAIIFRPFRRTQIFRFWHPFKDFKHGKNTALTEMSNEFLESVKQIGL